MNERFHGHNHSDLRHRIRTVKLTVPVGSGEINGTSGQICPRILSLSAFRTPRTPFSDSRARIFIKPSRIVIHFSLVDFQNPVQGVRNSIHRVKYVTRLVDAANRF